MLKLLSIILPFPVFFHSTGNIPAFQIIERDKMFWILKKYLFPKSKESFPTQSGNVKGSEKIVLKGVRISEAPGAIRYWNKRKDNSVASVSFILSFLSVLSFAASSVENLSLFHVTKFIWWYSKSVYKWRIKKDIRTCVNCKETFQRKYKASLYCRDTGLTRERAHSVLFKTLLILLDVPETYSF